MKKKIYSLLLAFSLVITLFGSTSAFAKDTGTKEQKDKILAAVAKAASKGKAGTYQIDGMTVNLDLDYLVVDKKNKKTQWMEDKPKTQGATTQAIEIGSVAIAHSIVFIPPERVNDAYPGTGQVASVIYIYDISGFAPSSIQATVDVNTDNNKDGAYSEDFSELSVDWGFFDIYEGQGEVKYQDVSQTKFYKYEFDGTVNYYWFDSDHESETKGPFLANKKAFQYPCRYYDPKQTRVPQPCMEQGTLEPIYYKDPYSDLIMFPPNTTLLPKLPPEDQVPRDENLRYKFIKYYVETYGDPKKKNSNFDWGDYDIHHIIPLDHGGTNDFGNLIPLKREFHQQNVTPWWTNY